MAGHAIQVDGLVGWLVSHALLNAYWEARPRKLQRQVDVSEGRGLRLKFLRITNAGILQIPGVPVDRKRRQTRGGAA